MLRPYPRVDHPDDLPLSSIPLPSDHGPRVLGDSEEARRVGHARAKDVVLLNVRHGGLLLQEAHLQGGQAGSEGVEGIGVTVGRKGVHT